MASPQAPGSSPKQGRATVGKSVAQQSAPPTAVPQVQVMQIMTSPIVAQSLYAAVSLGVPDQLKAGPKTVDDLASSVGADAGALFRVLRALASVGVFSLTDDGRCALTPAAECLCTDVAHGLRDMVLMMGSRWRLRAWEEIVHSVKTGKAAFDAVFGVGPFEYFRHHPEAASVFHRAMVSYTSTVAAALADAYDLSGCSTLVDVAGGHGYLLATLLQRNPHLRGVLFDLPEVVAGAEPLLEQSGVADRCRVVGGSFFEEVVAGGDVYVMKQIIHDWDDERSLAILGNCRKAMKPSARLLLVESVIPSGPEPAHAKLLDIEVLVALGGKERTERQYSELLAAAGLEMRRVLTTSAGIQIIESVPS
jgi:hypothetical protein